MDEQATLALRVEQFDGHLVIWVAGELDVYSSPRLQHCFDHHDNGDAASPPHVVLDLSDLDFVDSTGLNVVVLLRNDCAPKTET